MLFLLFCFLFLPFFVYFLYKGDDYTLVVLSLVFFFVLSFSPFISSSFFCQPVALRSSARGYFFPFPFLFFNALRSVDNMALNLLALVSSLLALSMRAAAIGPPQCPANTPMSCVKGASTGNDCCHQNPGFVILAQIFWVHPSVGPKDSWTIHGLWYVDS